MPSSIWPLEHFGERGAELPYLVWLCGSGNISYTLHELLIFIGFCVSLWKVEILEEYKINTEYIVNFTESFVTYILENINGAKFLILR
jgi:hypothetical protein